MNCYTVMPDSLIARRSSLAAPGTCLHNSLNIGWFPAITCQTLILPRLCNTAAKHPCQTQSDPPLALLATEYHILWSSSALPALISPFTLLFCMRPVNPSFAVEATP
jgi:hypothetical protein